MIFVYDFMFYGFMFLYMISDQQVLWFYVFVYDFVVYVIPCVPGSNLKRN